MSVTTTPKQWKHGAILALTALLLASLWSGCGDDNKNDNNPGPGGGATSTSFVGVISNGTENGSLHLTVNTTHLAPKSPLHQAVRLTSLMAPSFRSHEAVVTASGQIKLVGGGTVDLTGSYDDQSDSLNASGGGYTLGGEADTSGSNASISGGYTGPSGSGFFGTITGVAGAAVYCGTFASGSSGQSGTWDIVTGTAGTIAGVGIPTSGDPVAFEGTIATTGTMRALNAVHTEPGQFTLTVTGTLNTTSNTFTGNWTYDDLTVSNSDDSGTWSGSPCP